MTPFSGGPKFGEHGNVTHKRRPAKTLLFRQPGDNMYLRWAALALVLALSAFAPERAAGQQPSSLPSRRKPGTLGQNVPNPANPGTTIPFTVGDDSCADSVRQHVVSLRIYNILSQLVAVPKLRTASPPGADSARALASRPVLNLRLTCGSYSAFWDGRYMAGNRAVPAGTSVYELVVDGHREVRKMMVAK